MKAGMSVCWEVGRGGNFIQYLELLNKICLQNKQNLMLKKRARESSNCVYFDGKNESH